MTGRLKHMERSKRSYGKNQKTMAYQAKHDLFRVQAYQQKTQLLNAFSRMFDRTRNQRESEKDVIES